jgi:hypothetical protein
MAVDTTCRGAWCTNPNCYKGARCPGRQKGSPGSGLQETVRENNRRRPPPSDEDVKDIKLPEGLLDAVFAKVDLSNPDHLTKEEVEQQLLDMVKEGEDLSEATADSFDFGSDDEEAEDWSDVDESIDEIDKAISIMKDLTPEQKARITASLNSEAEPEYNPTAALIKELRF